MKKIVVMCIVAVSLLAACDNQKEENSSNLLPLLLGGGGGEGHDWTLMSGVNTDAPSSTVKLVFVHHSTGSAWIETGTGNLGQELNANNYWVAESDYGWGPTVAPYGDAIGSHTDTVDWPNWFGSSTVMSALYASTHHEDFTNSTSMSDPGGENTIIMFKSCFPNSEVGDSIDDEKAIYNGLLPYFAAHTDKMFMLIVPPPEIVISSAVLTRELADWLVAADGWLSGYTGGNVYAFDYYNVLTDPNNHHRVEGTALKNVKHIVTDTPAQPLHPNELYYPTGDSHPSAAGHQKATAEFVPYLNACYNRWKGI